MSDDIVSVMTPYPDVASLAQGYMNRADGERLLLPLPLANPQGAGVRFVVYLADGTPAFAGAGLCAQVSDQGGTVPAEQRFETLLDTLQFDERSRPVYDYIVAVRAAAYAQQPQPAAEGEGEGAPPEAEAGEAGGEAYEEATSLLVSGTSDAPASLRPESWAPAEGLEPVIEQSQPASEPSPEPELLQREPSFVPPPIPTGLLTRPARATHWQPAPPRRPTPRPSSGLFRYRTGGLPRPEHPPQPELDPAHWVRPAPRP